MAVAAARKLSSSTTSLLAPTAWKRWPTCSAESCEVSSNLMSLDVNAPSPTPVGAVAGRAVDGICLNRICTYPKEALRIQQTLQRTVVTKPRQEKQKKNRHEGNRLWPIGPREVYTLVTWTD